MINNENSIENNEINTNKKSNTDKHKNMKIKDTNKEDNENLRLLLPEECFICFEEYKSDDDITVLECCKKKIHVECLQRWYDAQKEVCYCPHCKDIKFHKVDITENNYQVESSSNSEESSEENDDSTRSIITQQGRLRIKKNCCNQHVCFCVFTFCSFFTLFIPYFFFTD